MLNSLENNSVIYWKGKIEIDVCWKRGWVWWKYRVVFLILYDLDRNINKILIFKYVVVEILFNIERER